MLNILSLVVGVPALILAIIAFFPLLGWANWFILPLPVIGLVLGLLSSKNTGRNLNIIVLVICIVRLSLGGGIF